MCADAGATKQCGWLCGRTVHTVCLHGAQNWGCYHCANTLPKNMADVRRAKLDVLAKASAVCDAQKGVTKAGKDTHAAVAGPLQDGWRAAQAEMGINKVAHPTYVYVGNHVEKLIDTLAEELLRS